MSDIVLQMNNIYKKFERGEKHSSLRDFIPALACRWFKGMGRDLQKTEFWALNDISISVKRGEAFGIIGPNGAGKTTILKLLTHILTPTQGDLRVSGRLSALIEVGAGFHHDLTGRENIYLYGTILGMKKNEIRKQFNDIVEFSGLEEFIDTPIKRYSSGMHARLGFSVAAHVNPDILVVDEVLSVGDYLFQRKCIAKMKAIMKSGVTLLFVSHDLKAVGDLCSRAMLLEKGKCAMIGDTKEVIQSYLNRYQTNQGEESDSGVSITKVSMTREKGESSWFEPGEKLFINVQVSSKVRHRELSIALYIKDGNYYEIFNTSTARLANSTFSPEAGEIWHCTFEICLHLTAGSYYLGVVVYQYNIDRLIHEWFPAGTIFMTSDSDVRGGANLYPKLALDLQPVSLLS